MKKILSIALLFIIGSGHSQINDSNRFYIDYNNINVPESPNAASLGSYGNIPINTATGIPNISIPIYTIEEDGLRIPISLSYHASGITVNETATSVGLKWTLNAGGGIFRTVKGKPDEDGWLSNQFGPLSDSWYDDNDLEDDNWQYAMGGNGANSYQGKVSLHDHNPDDFRYSFLGFSGEFILSEYGDPLKIQADELFIEFDRSFPIIEDQSGNTYEFGGAKEISDRHYVYANTTTGGGQGGPSGYDFDGNITGWMLKSIKTKNNKNIDFIYESYKIEEYTTHVVANSISYIDVCGTDDHYARFTSTSVTNDYTVQLVKEINTENVKIEFSYEIDPDVSTWKKKLTKIRINDLLNGNKKDFNLEYDKFSGDPRLKLEKVFEVGYKNGMAESKPPYEFEYDSSSLPEKYSFSQDFFGYYNGASNNSLIPHSFEADGYFGGLYTNVNTFYQYYAGDRSLNPYTIQSGVLKKITYPTGGSTLLTYEPNAEIVGNNLTKYCGGLRVANIEDKDSDGVVVKNTNYSYENLFGDDFESKVENTVQRNFGLSGYGISSTSFSSSFVGHPNAIYDGYFYKKVTTLITDNGEQQKKEDHYTESYNSFGKYNFILTAEKIFKNNTTTPIKLTEYQYEEFGTKETMEWNILGNMFCIPKPTYPPEAPQAYLGYNDRWEVNTYNNWVNLPIRIATTDFLKQGTSTEPVTTVQFIDYNDETLLKTIELTSTRYKRETDGSLTIPAANSNEEEVITYYIYPWSSTVNLDLPAALPIGKEVFSSVNGIGQIFGQFFEYDEFGNIKKAYQYDKGEVGNNSAPNYVPNEYEEMTNFIFEDGNPVQMFQKSGEATSYIWGYNGQFPVAKIEGMTRAALNSQLGSLVGQIETETDQNDLQDYLDDLRNDTTTANAMVTTYTYEPLNGVKTITDPKGDIITFYYDAFGRLEQVKDKDGNILSENEYNYAD